MKKQELNKSYCKVLDDLNWWYDVPTEKGPVKITYCTTLLTFTAYLSVDKFVKNVEKLYSDFDSNEFAITQFDNLRKQNNELPNIFKICDETREIESVLEDFVIEIDKISN
jgi:hypothetical protein